MLEKEVIENIVKFSETKFLNRSLVAKILKQSKNSKVTSRDFSGVGFFTYFQVDDKSLSLGNNINLQLGGIGAEIEGLKYNTAGFTLFIENGMLALLEGYSYGDDKWPKKITNYKLYLINPDGSLAWI